MNAQPQRTLKRLLKQYGQELIDDPRRTEALLRDHCGQYTREIFVLVNAQKQRVPSELRAAPAWMPRQATYSRLSRQLQTKLALTEDAADWAVAAWAAALDLDSPPKGDGWSWLPAPLRAPASPPRSRKARSKKRQNSPSGVQSPKESSRQKATRQSKERAMRAELGWNFPKLHLTLPAFLWRGPVAWGNILPWVALVVASIFLLAVVYWTSPIRVPQLAGDGVSEGVTPAVTSQTEATVDPLTPVDAGNEAQVVLPLPPSTYLSQVMPLPAVANVNVNVGPLFIRGQPSIDSDVLGFLSQGDSVHVVAFSEDGEWSQIDQPTSGWVSNEFLLFTSQDAPTSVRLDVQQRRTQPYEVGVRVAPSAGAALTATLSPGALVVVAAEMGDPVAWYQIADPALGWIAANDLLPESP